MAPLVRDAGAQDLVQRLGHLFVYRSLASWEKESPAWRLLTAIRCEDGPLPVDAAVVAAGIWSKPLAAELGDRIPLETERGYHIMIRNPEVVPRIPTADAEKASSWRPQWSWA